MMNERDRVLQVMQSEGMNAKQFCQEVGISQGTLSNILGGRNKPSLDVMQAILRRFRAVSCNWLIMGVGTMYANGAREEGLLTLFDNQPEPEEVKTPAMIEGASSPVTSTLQKADVGVGRVVSKIVVFYSDGTFEER